MRSSSRAIGLSLVANLLACSLLSVACQGEVPSSPALATPSAANEEAPPTSQAQSDDHLGVGGSIHGYDLDCAAPAAPETGSCTPTDADNACQKCVADRCCSEQSACNALRPMNACAFGSTLFRGRALDGGEIGCVMDCLVQRSSDGLLAGTPSDVDACSQECAASECGADSVSEVTRSLAACIVGDAEHGIDGCRSACELFP